MRLLRSAVLAVVASMSLSACDFNVYDIPLPGGTDTGDNPLTIEVQFADVLDLVPQSGVKVNDVDVGQVSDIELDGATALVTLEIKDGLGLPENVVAEIRQTSLLGEKFVELKAPDQGATGSLEDGETIPLERAGRNPEVEEVLGALSLVLNGGGIAQLKTISVELGNALEGRESNVKSALSQLEQFTGQLDERKADIVDAIESLDRLARRANEQEQTINAALDELPSAIASVNSQRGDLVTMLQALDNLSEIGTRVIRQSKGATIATLQRLDPVLTQLANAGDNFVDAFQVFLTYPFVDEVVGRDPQVARNLGFGDYTNLAIKLDLDLGDLLAAETACTGIKLVRDEVNNGADGIVDRLEGIANGDIGQLCDRAAVVVDRCLGNVTDVAPNLRACQRLIPDLTGQVLEQVCASLPLPGCEEDEGGLLGNGPLRNDGPLGNNGPLGNDGPLGNNGPLGNRGGRNGGDSGGSGSGSGSGGPLGGVLNRAPFGGLAPTDSTSGTPALRDLDSDLVYLLVRGVLAR